MKNQVKKIEGDSLFPVISNWIDDINIYTSMGMNVFEARVQNK